jgi:uncharacterized membrane protein
MSTLVFNETIKIDAPISIVFSVITDYDSYDELLPMLHDSIEITSEDESGQGVTWESTGTFKGHSFTTEWTVTEFIENEMVKMEDLEEGIGETVLTTTLKDENETEYSMYISTKMFKPYEKDFIEIYREEMSIIKAESERIFSTQIN